MRFGTFTIHGGADSLSAVLYLNSIARVHASIKGSSKISSTSIVKYSEENLTKTLVLFIFQISIVQQIHIL